MILIMLNCIFDQIFSLVELDWKWKWLCMYVHIYLCGCMHVCKHLYSAFTVHKYGSLQECTETCVSFLHIVAFFNFTLAVTVVTKIIQTYTGNFNEDCQQTLQNGCFYYTLPSNIWNLLLQITLFCSALVFAVLYYRQNEYWTDSFLLPVVLFVILHMFCLQFHIFCILDFWKRSYRCICCRVKVWFTALPLEEFWFKTIVCD